MTKRNDAPSLNLASDGELALPASIADPVSDEVVDAGEQLMAEYRDLWKRLNAKHRATTYGTAGPLSQTSSDPAELAVLAQFQGEGIAMNVAQNPATPGPVLHMLAIGESDCRTDQVRQAALMHPNCPEETIRLVWAHRKQISFLGAASPAVATAPNTPLEILRAAAVEGDEATFSRTPH